MPQRIPPHVEETGDEERKFDSEGLLVMSKKRRQKKWYEWDAPVEPLKKVSPPFGVCICGRMRALTPNGLCEDCDPKGWDLRMSDESYIGLAVELANGIKEMYAGFAHHNPAHYREDQEKIVEDEETDKEPDKKVGNLTRKGSW